MIINKDKKVTCVTKSACTYTIRKTHIFCRIWEMALDVLYR